MWISTALIDPAGIFSIKLNAMFLKLNHQKLEVYKASLDYVTECYRLCGYLPQEERFGIISQIKRAALSVHLNIAEGASRKSEAERKRYFEISRGSMVEIDAAFDIAVRLNFIKNCDITLFEEKTIYCFKLLCGLV
ncbi:MAG TPA: four helix bundle protein [Chitinophagaceae bacterium]|nr:four helix bundle protein [Chitinophagaceae bacterium]